MPVLIVTVIDNIRKRLEAQCGGYLEYTSPEIGTEAVIHIPLKTEKGE